MQYDIIHKTTEQMIKSTTSVLGGPNSKNDVSTVIVAIIDSSNFIMSLSPFYPTFVLATCLAPNIPKNKPMNVIVNACPACGTASNTLGASTEYIINNIANDTNVNMSILSIHFTPAQVSSTQHRNVDFSMLRYIPYYFHSTNSSFLFSDATDRNPVMAIVVAPPVNIITTDMCSKHSAIINEV